MNQSSSSSSSDGVTYVGPADLHDAQVLSVEQDRDQAQARVLVQSLAEPLQETQRQQQPSRSRWFVLEFSGVVEVRAVRPEGMVLYALTELADSSTSQQHQQQQQRRFAFVNWDEDDDARLEVVAQAFRVYDSDPGSDPGSHQDKQVESG